MEAFILLILTVRQISIYIEYVCSLYLMQYVTLMIGEDFWLTVDV